MASKEQSNPPAYRAASQVSRSSLDQIPPPTSTVSLISLLHHIQPRSTPSPTCCGPNQVIIELSTTVVIKDYQRFYSADINSFSPTYFVTDDGSLITPALRDDLWNANLNLLLTVALAMLFIRNIAVAIDYLRRGKMKNKILFYLLFASQALAPASLVPLLLSFFNQDINCTVIMALSSVTGSFALAILLTGIIGIKTYRCMNDSIIVAAVIAVLEFGHIAFVILDARAIRGARRIAGSCSCQNDLRYTRVVIAVQMAECCFMIICFMYTCIKYRKTPGARGRISLRMSMEELPTDPLSDMHYGDVLAGVDAQYQPDSSDQKTTSLTKPSGEELRGTSADEKSSGPHINYHDDGRSHARKSFASSLSRLSRLLSNMVNLRKVMRDELLYTCAVTVIIALALVFTFTGMNIKNGIGVTGWITLTWGLVSIFIIHSSGRVIRRHERESLVRYATSRAVSRVGPATPWLGGTNTFWVPRSSPHVRNRQTTTLSQNSQLGDPYSDTQQLRQLEGRRPSYQSEVTSSTASNLSSPLGPMMGVTNLKDSVGLPSPGPGSSFPTSGQGTPIALQGAAEGNLGSFSKSWIPGQDPESQFFSR